jgi:energy-coupling factor transporter ATP-binding protein EcfA2
MALHRMSGMTLASDIPLPELPRARGASAEIRFGLLPPGRPFPSPLHWLHRWRRPDGRAWISLGGARHGYLLRFTSLADFLLSRDGARILGRPRPRVSPATIRHLLLDQVLPMVFAHRGSLALHASAVRLRSGVVAFVGKSGSGKSTLCASLTRVGRPLLADDCLVIEEQHGRAMAVPSYPGLRLRPNIVRALWHDGPRGPRVAEYSDKRRLGPRGLGVAAPGPAPLWALYLLVPPGTRGEIRITRVVPREAVGRLLAHTHRLDITDRARLVVELEALTRLARRVPVFELAYPRGLHRLPAVHAALLRHVAAEI